MFEAQLGQNNLINHMVTLKLMYYIILNEKNKRNSIYFINEKCDYIHVIPEGQKCSSNNITKTCE